MPSQTTLSSPLNSDLQADAALSAVTPARQTTEDDSEVLRWALNSIQDFTYVFDREGRFVYSNQALLDLLGITHAEIVGKNFFDLKYPAELAERLQRQIEEVFKTGQVVQDETLYVNHAGKIGYYEYIFTPVKEGGAALEYVAGSTRDITRRRQAIEDLRESQEKYHTLFSSIDEGFCVLHLVRNAVGEAEDYRIVEVNPAFERQSGLKDSCGRTIKELLPRGDLRRLHIYDRVARTGESIRFESREDQLGRWFDVYAFQVDGVNSDRVAVLFTDISMRKQVEKERETLARKMAHEHAKLDYLFTQAPAFVATLSGPEHVFERTNPAFLQLIGHRDVTGKPVREALPEVEGQGFFDLLDGVYATGIPFTGAELAIQLQRGPEGPLEGRRVNFVYQPIFDSEGRVEGIFAHGVDVTDQVRARQEAETANRAKDEFLATLSHELRTPLTAIMGWTDILQTGPHSPEEMELGLATIARNARAQAQLVEDILDVSRMITGKMNLDLRPVNLSEVVDQAITTILPAAQAKGTSLVSDLEVHSCLVSGDSVRLQQVVWNLLSNAVKFTPAKGQVRAALRRTSTHVEIQVSDNGVGIAPDMVPLVFDRFRQADATSTRSQGGLGLGLAIVRYLVELHGGQVLAESRGLGLGASFTVRLPLLGRPSRSTPEEETSPASESASSPAAALSGLKILLVDDQEDTREFLGLALAKRGAVVETAATAREAMKLLARHRPHVLLSDIGMPEEDGFELIRKVRALTKANGGQIPAAALTAFARAEDRAAVLQSGFQAHLAKPVNIEELTTLILTLAGRTES